MIEINRKDAERQHYKPDSTVCAGDVPAGVGAQASGERFAEITLGRAYCQQRLAATYKD